MQEVKNEEDFKAALSSLSPLQQRQVGALFIDNVIDLVDDQRVKNANIVAHRENATADEIEDAYRSVKSIAVDTYAICGEDTVDWSRQVLHFLAAACAQCLLAGKARAYKSKNLAWLVATNLRMARCCASIARGEEEDDREAVTQYKILSSFLQRQ